MTEVILVDTADREIGFMEKMRAHEEGVLHRAFSVFVFNEANELLIHRRAYSKYHSGGLWTNTCCSHPLPGEAIADAAHRRLQEEMGFDCELKHVYSFVYKAVLDQGLTEHELDHVFFGHFSGEFLFNEEEVAETRYISIDDLKEEIRLCPENFTEWFKIILANIDGYL